MTITTLEKPKSPRADKTTPFDAIELFGAGDGLCISGTSGDVYAQAWTPRAGRLDILPCPCRAGEVYKACRHMVRAQAILDAVAAVMPAGGRLRHAWTATTQEAADALRCPCGGERVTARVWVPGRADVTFGVCLCCGPGRAL